MKKYFIIGAIILVLGVVLNYSFGGFNKTEAQLIKVSDYNIYGASFEGSYKSTGLTNLVDDMREIQSENDSTASVVIVNYVDEAKETLGIVSNFVGISGISVKSGLDKLELRRIKATQAIRMEIKITPIAMPSPEKTKALAYELASKKGLELQGLSIEQYKEGGILVIDFPIKEPASFIEKLSEAYGLSKFNIDKTYKYTFNVKKGEAGVARSWEWQPSSGKVTLISKGDTIKFNHKTLLKDQQKLDHTFINDKYWLIFPFQLVWDTGYDFKLITNVKAPISGKEVTKLVINYNSKDGYTPGDGYDFYVDELYEIKEWSFRKGGQPEPSLTTTWENYENIDGIKISTNHQTEDSGFRLWFTGVSVE